MRREWTRTEIDRVGGMVAQDWTIARIGRAIGRDESTVRRLVRRLWPARPPVPSAMPEDDFLAIKAMIDAGLNTRAIVRRTSYSQAQVLAARAERVRRANCERTARHRMAGTTAPARGVWHEGAFYENVTADDLAYEDAAWADGRRKVPPARDLAATVEAWLLSEARRAA